MRLKSSDLSVAFFSWVSRDSHVVQRSLTEASKLIENVFLVLGAALRGFKVNSCCVQSPRTLLDLTLVLANTSPVELDWRETVKDPLYDPLT